VEVYQWIETKTKNAEGENPAEYSYSKEWKDSIIAPSSFNSKPPEEATNPETWPVETEDMYNQTVLVERYHIQESLLTQLTDFKDLQFDHQDCHNIDS